MMLGLTIDFGVEDPTAPPHSLGFSLLSRAQVIAIIASVDLSVLLVDDDPEFLALATRVFEGMGIDVVATAVDAGSAVTAASTTKPQAALVDVGLPDRDGIELGKQLAALPWRPLVILTSTDNEAAIESRAAPLPFLPKEELASGRIRDLLGLS